MRPKLGKSTMAMPRPVDGGFEARMAELAKGKPLLKQKPKDLAAVASQAYDKDAAEQARRAANLKAAQDQERQAKMRDQAEQARRAANVRKARGGY